MTFDFLHIFYYLGLPGKGYLGFFAMEGHERQVKRFVADQYVRFCNRKIASQDSMDFFSFCNEQKVLRNCNRPWVFSDFCNQRPISQASQLTTEFSAFAIGRTFLILRNRRRVFSAFALSEEFPRIHNTRKVFPALDTGNEFLKVLLAF